MTRPIWPPGGGWGYDGGLQGGDGDWNEAKGSDRGLACMRIGCGLAAQHAKVIYGTPLGSRCDSLTGAEGHTFPYVGIYVGK